MRVPCVAAVICAAVCAATCCHAVQVLTNGDFEGGATGGVPNGWTKVAGTTYSCSGYTAEWRVFTTPMNNYPSLDVYAGTASLGAYRTDGFRCSPVGYGLEFYEWNVLYQTVPVNPNTTYYVRASAAAFTHHDRMNDLEDFWGAGIGLRICLGAGIYGSDRFDDGAVVWKHNFWNLEGDSFWRYYSELTNQKDDGGGSPLPNSFYTGPNTAVTFAIVWFVKWDSEMDMCALDNVQLDLTSTGPAPPGSTAFTVKDPPTWSNPDQVWEPTDKTRHWSRVGATDGGERFYQSLECTTGMMPRNSAAADLNGDGLVDLAVVSEWSHLVSVFLQRPDGGFEPGSHLAGAVMPRCVQAGQLVGSAAVDLIVTSAGTREVLVFPGIGDGTFGSPQTVAAPLLPWWVVVADFNNDGLNDFAVSSQPSSGEGWVDIYLAVTLGSFTASARLADIGYPSYIVARDFGGPFYVPDGKVDLAVLSWWGSVEVFMGAGDGTFGWIQTISSQGRWKSTAMASANFDEDPDNIPDLCISYMWEADWAQLAQGLGDCYFLEQPTDEWLRPGRFPSGVDAIDYNSDTHPDLAFSNYGSADCVLYQNMGSTMGWNFGAGGRFGVGMSNTHLLTADVNSDGFDDMVITGGATQTVNVIYGGPGGVIGAPNASLVGANAAAIADFVESTPLPDVAVGATGVQVFRNNGYMGFVEVYSYNPFATGTVVDMETADLNSDASQDILCLRRESSSSALVYTLLGDGAGGFSVGMYQLSGGNESQDIAVADFNNATGPDFVGAESQLYYEGVYCRLNNGSGGFGGVFDKKKTALPINSKPRDLDTADFNSDGRKDVVVALAGTNQFALMTGKGDGYFNTPVYFSAGGEPTGICAADFNGDSKADVAVTQKLHDTVRIFLGSGAGAFTAGPTIAVGSQPTRVFDSDFDLDGKPDLVVGNSGEQTFAYLKGLGDGTFAAPRFYRTSGVPNRFAAGDLRVAGAPDLFAAVGSWEIFRNAGNPQGTISASDDGASQTYTDHINGSWTATTGPGRWIVRYRWAVSSTPDTSGIIGGGGWRYTTETSDTRSVSLNQDQTYYILAQAEDSENLWSAVASSDGILVQAPVAVTTAGQAKQQPDGTAVTLSGAIVSRSWPGSSWVCYVQDPDRSGGIRVEGGGSVPAAGDQVTVTGQAASTGFERAILASGFSVAATPGEPDALGMSGGSLGGGDFIYVAGPPASGQIGVLGGIGTNNVGLLVRVAGHVTRSESGEVFFYLDDGSSLDDGSGYTGVRCIAAGLVKPSTPSFVIVTGVSGVTDINGQPARCIRVQRQEDIVHVW